MTTDPLGDFEAWLRSPHACASTRGYRNDQSCQDSVLEDLEGLFRTEETVKTVAFWLRSTGVPKEEALARAQAAVEAVYPPALLEVWWRLRQTIRENPLYFVDNGHDPKSTTAVCTECQETHEDQTLYVGTDGSTVLADPSPCCKAPMTPKDST